MAYTARLTKQQLRQRREATRDRSRDNTKMTVQYLVTCAYTNNNCLLCASNIIVSVAIPIHHTFHFCKNHFHFHFYFHSRDPLMEISLESTTTKAERILVWVGRTLEYVLEYVLPGCGVI